MHMLGYEVDFGHEQGIQLMGSSKFTEKYTGYMSACLLVKADSESFKQAIYPVRSDVGSGIEMYQSLALALIAHNANEDLLGAVDRDVARMAQSFSSQNITKKALATLSKLYKNRAHLISHESWAPHISTLLEHKSPGMLLSVTGLLL